MCIEYEKVEHYVPSGDVFQVDMIFNDTTDVIPVIDPEERRSENSGTVASAGTDIVSSL